MLRPVWCFSLAVLFATSMAAAPLTLAAQEAAPRLRPGTRIRVTLNSTPPTTVVAIMDSVSADTLHFHGVQASSQRALPWSAAGPQPFLPVSVVRTLEVSGGRHSYWRVGAGVGFLVGLGIGVVVANSKTTSQCSAFSCIGADVNQKAIDITVGMLGGALVGGIIGAGIGSEKWGAVPLEKLQMGTVNLKRVGVRVSLRL